MSMKNLQNTLKITLIGKFLKKIKTGGAINDCLQMEIRLQQEK